MKNQRHRVDRSVHDDFIVTHYRKDMTTKQIARYLKIPRGTVISRYHISVGNRVKNEYFPTGEGHFKNKWRGKFCL